jgi:uncharacterized protein
MKFSNHTIIVKDYPNSGEHVLYNTRSQGMVKISETIRDVIDNFTNYPSSIKDQYSEVFNNLHQVGILVKDEEEDQLRLKSHLQQIKNETPKSSLLVTVLTTYACNFKCTYCFQESSRTNEKMSAETSDHVLNWLKEQVEKFDYKELFINFYGGEPLVNKPTLEKIVSHMKEWCEARGVVFKFMLQTNGYLMTSELIDRYLTMGLDQVRISVDGVSEDHDRFRPLRKGGNTFDTIMKNIVDCAHKVMIGISVSYDKGEIGHIERLLNYLDNLGLLKVLGEFVFSPIFATLGAEGDAANIQNSSCMCNFEDSNLVDANKRIRILMEDKGLPIKSGMSTSVCPLTRKHSGPTIDQHGLLYKCNSMLGHPELSVGNVNENEYNKQHEEFVSLDVWKQCPSDCTYMPMCSGGCRLSSFLKNKNFKTPSCHKSYLNAMAPQYIKEEYEKLMQRQQVKEKHSVAW